MISLSQEEQQIVEAILYEHVPNHRVALFGSRAKGTKKRFADLDLMIYGNRTLSLSALALLKQAFSDSSIPFRVDVLDAAQTSEEFLQKIQNESIMIQEPE